MNDTSDLAIVCKKPGCDRVIQPITAEKTGGFCAPCAGYSPARVHSKKLRIISIAVVLIAAITLIFVINEHENSVQERRYSEAESLYDWHRQLVNGEVTGTKTSNHLSNDFIIWGCFADDNGLDRVPPRSTIYETGFCIHNKHTSFERAQYVVVLDKWSVTTENYKYKIVRKSPLSEIESDEKDGQRHASSFQARIYERKSKYLVAHKNFEDVTLSSVNEQIEEWVKSLSH